MHPHIDNATFAPGYMASVLQCILPLEPFASRYGGSAALAHIASCNATHANCFHCQMGKLGIALASGRYSTEPAEFSTWRAMREQQQCAAISTDSESVEEKERRRTEKEETDKLFKDWQVRACVHAARTRHLSHHFLNSNVAHAHPFFSPAYRRACSSL